MAKTYSGLLAGLGALPVQPPEAGKGVNAFVHVHRQVLTLASQPTTEQPVIARLPAGHLFLFGIMTTSATLGSSTVAIGNETTAGKYRAAATFTSANTPTLFGIAAAADDEPLAADEEVIITIAAAAFPSSGTLITQIYTSKP